MQKCLSLIFNNYDLSHREQFGTDLFSVLVCTFGSATVEGKMMEKKAAKLRSKRTKDRIFQQIPHFLRRAQKLEKASGNDHDCFGSDARNGEGIVGIRQRARSDLIGS